MISRTSPHAAALALLALLASCAHPSAFTPTEVVDLGALVTDDLPQRVWGTGFLKAMNFTKQNSVELIKWTFPVPGADSVHGSNAYYSLFNHGGPHVDGPNHVGAGGGIDSYRVQSFSGVAKVFDVRGLRPGRSIPVSVFRGRVQPGDIVLVLTGYTAPAGDSFPVVTTLTHEAAEYLANLPIRAFGTDAFSVEALTDATAPWIHQSLLSRGIPVYEQLQHVDRLLGKRRLFFSGTPLEIKDGDGMMVRPVVFVY
jgi:kynurenine formamidase